MGPCLYLLQHLRPQLHCMLRRNMGDFLSMRRRTLWPPLNSPDRWGDFSFECAVTWSLWRFRLFYSGIVANNCVRSGYDDLVIVALYTAWVQCHVARWQAEPNPEHEIQWCGCVLQHFLIASDAAWDVNGRGNRVFNIRQELFLGVKSRSSAKDIWTCLSLRSQDCPNISVDRVIKSCHTRLCKAVWFVKNECCPGHWNVAFIPDCFHWVEEYTMLCLMCMPIFVWWCHVCAPWSEALTSMIQLLPPVCIWWHTELRAKPLVGPSVIVILIPGMGFVSRKGDAQFL